MSESDANLDETLRPYLRLAGMDEATQDKVIAGVSARLSAAVDALPEVHGTGTMYVGVVYVERDAVKQILNPAAAERIGRA